MKMQFYWDESVDVNEAMFVQAGVYGTDIFLTNP